MVKLGSVESWSLIPIGIFFSHVLNCCDTDSMLWNIREKMRVYFIQKLAKIFSIYFEAFEYSFSPSLFNFISISCHFPIKSTQQHNSQPSSKKALKFLLFLKKNFKNLWIRKQILFSFTLPLYSISFYSYQSTQIQPELELESWYF